MTRPAMTRNFGWVLAFTATWFAWAWLNTGFLPVGLLGAALTVAAARRNRASERRPGLPRPANGDTTAAYVVGALFLSLMIGFGPDWLVLGGLGVSLVVKLRAASRVVRG